MVGQTNNNNNNVYDTLLFFTVQCGVQCSTLSLETTILYTTRCIVQYSTPLLLYCTSTVQYGKTIMPQQHN